MIGIVLTGHANFASGLTSSAKLIMGDKIDAFETVDFEGLDTGVLESDIKKSIDNLKECDGVLICCDIVGGSPFKTAVTSTVSNKNVAVIAGTNLPMLLDILFSRFEETDAKAFSKHAMQVAKEMVMVYETQEDQEEDLTDGI